MRSSGNSDNDNAIAKGSSEAFASRAETKGCLAPPAESDSETPTAANLFCGLAAWHAFVLRSSGCSDDDDNVGMDDHDRARTGSVVTSFLSSFVISNHIPLLASSIDFSSEKLKGKNERHEEIKREK